MQIQNIIRNTRRKAKKIVGRGGKRGTTSSRGTKGQKARSGHRIRPEIRDTIKKIPKMRGRGKNINTPIGVKITPVSVATLTRVFTSAADINPQILVANKIVRARGGVTPKVKILGTAALGVKLTVTGCQVSETARKAIEAAGGTVN